MRALPSGGMTENLMRQSGPRLRLADRGQQAEHLHGLEHALHVAAAAVVAPQAQPHPGFPQVANRCDAALELEVAEMVEHDARAGGRHAVHFWARYPDAVNDVEPRSEQAGVVEIADQRSVVLREQLARDQGLTPGLVDVGVDRRGRACARARRSLPAFVGVQRCGANGAMAQCWVPPAGCRRSWCSR